MDPKELRAATRREHEATEALMSLTHAGLTRDEYRAALRALEPVVTSWERWAAVWAPEGLQETVKARRRGELLRADLERLGAGEGDPARDAVVDWRRVVVGGDGREAPGGSAAFAAGFLGALYVMEGSTLGGRFLARHVSAVLGPAVEGATRYFSGYGEQTGAMWREITGEIEKVPEELRERTIEAARRCFAAFADGLRAAAGGFGGSSPDDLAP